MAVKDAPNVRGGPIPRATYRLQFHEDFTFPEAAALAPYLARLGISHVYASPIFKANPGSRHGYDIIDFGELNPEIGTRAEFEAMATAFRREGIGLILDFVPNHMGIASGRNAWWQDVLEHGPISPYASYFDIDWQPIKPELENQVLLPVLGDHYGVVLERQEICLRFDAGSFSLDYHGLPLPISPQTYPIILRSALPDIGAAYDADDLPLLEFQSIIAAFARLSESDLGLDDRRGEQLVAKHRLAQLVERQPTMGEGVQTAVDRFNGTPGVPASFDALDDLILHQHYRLAFWRVAADEINYRRFFAINELAAIRQEEPAVFEATHRLLLELIAQGWVDGVRIDHIDGLWDPAGYLRNVQTAVSATGTSIYLVVEKILEHGESLPEDWPIDGTVGYEFIQSAGGLFVDSTNRKAFDAIYARFTGNSARFSDLVYDAKKLIMRVALASEVNVLARALDQLSEHHRRTRDFTYNSLRDAMIEIIACFPVYRTYATCDPGEESDSDRSMIAHATTNAARRNPASDGGVFAFIRDILLLDADDRLTDEQRLEQCRFVARFQQLSGPVMAKGLEDTAFYDYVRLASLNEVGGDPAQFGVEPRDFHRANATRQTRWPSAMLASSTHDTKRSEDARARITALSEMPKIWRAAINRWRRLNRRFKTSVDGAPAPSANDEYLLYQTLIGTWPLDGERPSDDYVDRIEAYLLKAVHEAQVHTSWINPNQPYDAAVSVFVRGVLGNEAFVADFEPVRDRTALIGSINAIAQQLLKLTSPGVPDIYQGTELWDFSLVDPDNRRPVDYRARIRLLDELDATTTTDLADSLFQSWPDGRLKLFITTRTLDARRDHADLFERGAYTPLTAVGPNAAHIVAFARQLDEDEIIVVAPRLADRLTGGGSRPPVADVWSGATLPLARTSRGGRFRNRFTGDVFEATPTDPFDLRLVLAHLPVALLERIES